MEVEVGIRLQRDWRRGRRSKRWPVHTTAKICDARRSKFCIGQTSPELRPTPTRQHRQGTLKSIAIAREYAKVSYLARIARLRRPWLVPRALADRRLHRWFPLASTPRFSRRRPRRFLATNPIDSNASSPHGDGPRASMHVTQYRSCWVKTDRTIECDEEEVQRPGGDAKGALNA